MNSTGDRAPIVNKVEIALFLRDQGIPAREAIFAAVDLANQGIDAAGVKDAFADHAATHFVAVATALDTAIAA